MLSNKPYFALYADELSLLPIGYANVDGHFIGWDGGQLGKTTHAVHSWGFIVHGIVVNLRTLDILDFLLGCFDIDFGRLDLGGDDGTERRWGLSPEGWRFRKGNAFTFLPSSFSIFTTNLSFPHGRAVFVLCRKSLINTGEGK